MSDDATPDDPDDVDRDDARTTVLDAVEHLTNCLGMDPAEAAHCLAGCAFFIAHDELATADYAEWLSEVREVLEEREAELRGKAS